MTAEDRTPIVLWEVAPDAVRTQLQTVVALEAAGVDAAVLPGSSLSSPDPVLVAGAARDTTRRIGLIPSFSPWLQPPFHTARALGTLDALTGGRAGWFVVSDAPDFVSTDDTPRWNPAQADSAAELDAAVGDYLDAARALWNSWEPDALIADVAAGQYVDPRKVHVTDYHGDFFDVRGPLNMPRPPQGRPPLVARFVEESAASSRADLLVADTEDEVEAARAFAVESGVVVLRRLERPSADAPPPTAAAGYLISGVSAARDGELFGSLVHGMLPRLLGPAHPTAPRLLRDRLGLAPAAFEWSSPRHAMKEGTR